MCREVCAQAGVPLESVLLQEQYRGKVKFDQFMHTYLGNDPGDIVDAAGGRIIGRHNKLWYHMVGQRTGIGKVLHPIESSKGP